MFAGIDEAEMLRFIPAGYSLDSHVLPTAPLAMDMKFPKTAKTVAKVLASPIFIPPLSTPAGLLAMGAAFTYGAYRANRKIIRLI